MVYTWKNGARAAASAQAVGEECEKLTHTIGLTPANLLNESRPDGAPLHNCFEWNDAIAAENYRENQAAYLIRNIEIKAVDDETHRPTRAFISIAEEDEKAEYKPLGVVIANPDYHAQMMKQALDELKWFERKYTALHELDDVFAAIRRIKK